MSLEKFVTDVKTAWTVCVSTMFSGAATVLEKIPAEVGKLATLVGILLSLVLIYVHIKRIVMDAKSRELQDELTRLKIAKELLETERLRGGG